MIRLMNGNRAGFNSQIRLHFDSLTYNFVARFSENQYLNMTDIAWGKKGRYFRSSLLSTRKLTMAKYIYDTVHHRSPKLPLRVCYVN